MQGTFSLSELDGIDLASREAVLRQEQWRDEPILPEFAVQYPNFLSDFLEGILECLKKYGIAKLNLNESLSNSAFIKLGASLGVLIAEHSSVSKYVEDKFILNLIQEHCETENPEIQPFAENYLTLHSEMSFLPLSLQPKYILLKSERSLPPNCGGQTILSSMEGVYNMLTEEQKKILQLTGYSPRMNSNLTKYTLEKLPPFLYFLNNRPVFSFRDFGQQNIIWEYFGASKNGITPYKVNKTLSALLKFMYNHDNLKGIHWSFGTIWIIDNTFFFHGKTYYKIIPNHPRRWLKRLRIMERLEAGE